jgi:hypothetical protein
VRSPRGRDVFARTPGVFDADAEGYWGSMAKECSDPRAIGKDFFTSRMARDLKIFPYGWNIAAVVSVVMEKDRKDAAQKRRAVVRIGDPFREVKKARGAAKSAAPGGSKPLPAAKPAAPGPARLRLVRRLLLLVRASHPQAGPRRGEGCLRRRIRTRRQRVLPTLTRTSVSGIIYLVSFYWKSLTDLMVQGRIWGNWLLSRLRWRPLRQRRWLGRRVPHGTCGPPSARAARFCRSLPLRTWRAPYPSN